MVMDGCDYDVDFLAGYYTNKILGRGKNFTEIWLLYIGRYKFN